MKMTPETDALDRPLKDKQDVMILARKLERERNTLLAKVKELEKAGRFFRTLALTTTSVYGTEDMRVHSESLDTALNNQPKGE